MKMLRTLMLVCMLTLFAVPLHAESQVQNAIILLAFGTSDEEAKKSLDAIGKAYERQGFHVIWAYSSNMIRAKLKKQGDIVYSIEEAMDAAEKGGFKHLTIQSLHVTPSEEYMKINRLISRDLASKPKRFASIMFGHPLLMSGKDLEDVVTAMMHAIPPQRKADEAVIFMGHGNHRGTGDITLIAVNDAFQKADDRVFLACVEGALAFDKVLPILKEKQVKRVWQIPFMIVAGDHAKNDMAGAEADSWTSILRAQGYDVQNNVRGMGEIPAIQDVFLRHTEETVDDILNGKMIQK